MIAVEGSGKREIPQLIRNALGTPEPLRSRVQVVFVTTDPARDTGTVLAAWLRNFDPDLPRRIVGLTGTQAQVAAAQAAAKVPVATENGQTHSAEQLLYGQDALNTGASNDIQQAT